ncbi:hypothetical protein MLR89_21240, partial [Escherichia coli]|nr:hypothetical protein [Escherichia coli]
MVELTGSPLKSKQC